MKLDDDSLRTAYRKGTRRLREIDCPGSEALSRAAAGDLPPAERNALVSHLASCSDCSEELQLSRPLNLNVSSARGAARGTWRLVLPLAAVVVLAAGVAVVRQSSSRPGAPGTVRGAAASGQRTTPPDGAHLNEPPTELEWTNAPSAESFEIVVFDAESTELWRSAASPAPRAALPMDVRSSLKADAPYYWRVLAIRGVERSTSPLYRFEIAPRR